MLRGGGKACFLLLLIEKEAQRETEARKWPWGGAGTGVAHEGSHCHRERPPGTPRLLLAEPSHALLRLIYTSTLSGRRY